MGTETGQPVVVDVVVVVVVVVDVDVLDEMVLLSPDAVRAIPAATMPTPAATSRMGVVSDWACFTPAGLPAGRGDAVVAKAFETKRPVAKATAAKDRITTLSS